MAGLGLFPLNGGGGVCNYLPASVLGGDKCFLANSNSSNRIMAEAVHANLEAISVSAAKAGLKAAPICDIMCSQLLNIAHIAKNKHSLEPGTAPVERALGSQDQGWRQRAQSHPGEEGREGGRGGGGVKREGRGRFVKRVRG